MLSCAAGCSPTSWFRWACLLLVAGLTLLAAVTATSSQTEKPALDQAGEYLTQVRPFLNQYCLSCPSISKKKGALARERFASLDQVRKDIRHWISVAEMLENGEMPPKEKPQP